MNRPNAPQMQNASDVIAKKEAQRLVEFAKTAGDELAEADLSASQVRSVLDAIQAMRKYDASQLQLLRPKLAYAVAKKPELAGFRDIVESAIAAVKTDEDYKFFRYLIEAIVAYHALARQSESNKPGRRDDRRNGR